MIEQNVVKLSILVDLKKARIRISKNAIRSIGNPHYVLLLVNPEEQTLAILRSERSDPKAYRLHVDSLESNKPIELYSRSLLNNLRDISCNLRDQKSYQLYGEVISNEGVVRFHISDAVLINGTGL